MYSKLKVVVVVATTMLYVVYITILLMLTLASFVNIPLVDYGWLIFQVHFNAIMVKVNRFFWILLCILALNMWKIT